MSHRVAADFAQLHCQVTQIGQVLGIAATQQCPNLQHRAISIETRALMTVHRWTTRACIPDWASSWHFSHSAMLQSAALSHLKTLAFVYS